MVHVSKSKYASLLLIKQETHPLSSSTTVVNFKGYELLMFFFSLNSNETLNLVYPFLFSIACVDKYVFNKQNMM